MNTRKKMKPHLKVDRSGDSVEVSGAIQWVYAKEPDSGRFIGVCNILGITIEADSLKEMFDLITESTDALMDDLIKNDELEAFLRAQSWKNVSTKTKAKDIAPALRDRLDVRSVAYDDLQVATC